MQSILEHGDASVLVNLSSGPIRRHAMEALTAYAKFSGCYDSWQQIRKRYSLHWTNGDESVRSLQRFFDSEYSLDKMIELISEMAHKLPAFMGQMIRFGTLTGLRPSEVCESVRLFNSQQLGITYYNQERQTLEHFRFPEIFLRRTKKAYISFITKDQLSRIANLGSKTHTPTWNAIRSACRRKGINMDMRFCRKIHGSWLHQCGIPSEAVDFLQGRVSPSVFSRHYLTPDSSLRTRVLEALEKLQQQMT